MIRGAVFDVDGVLLDSMRIWKDLGARYLRRQGIVPAAGLNEILFSMSMEEGAAYLREEYHLPDTKETILQGIGSMLRDFYFEEVSAKPGAAQLLRFLEERKIPMALATSSPREHVVRALDRNGILGFFGGKLLTTGELGVSKHQPDIYRRAAQLLGSEPSETLVFEDSLYALTTAKKAGFVAVGVYDVWGESDRAGMERTADRYLTELSQFEMYWDELNSL